MPRRRVAVATTVLAVAVTGVALATPATAAPARPPLFQASAVGTTADLVGGVLTSSPTATTSLRTRATTQRTEGGVASVSIPGLLDAGGVSTSSSTARNASDTATIVTGHARTAGITLLNGVLAVDAVDTTSSLTVKPDKVTPRATTDFVNLRILGNATINGQVDPNTTIEVPGVARIVLNASGTVPGSTDGMAVATGITVELLSGTFVGSTIAINPTSAQTARVGLGYAPLGGFALGAQVTAGGDATASVGPFGAIGMPDVGTKNQTLKNSLAGVDLGLLGTIGTLTSTANGIATDAQSRSTMTAKAANVSLLGGLITATSMTSTAQVVVKADQAPVPTASVSFTGLAVAGVPVPLDAPAGLVLPLPGLGGVAVDATATTDTAAAAAALTITLSIDAFGLSAGATVQVGLAYANLLS